MLADECINAISRDLETDMQAKSKRRVYNYKTTGRVEYDEFYLKLSKPIIDEIDRVLAEHYGFTDEERTSSSTTTSSTGWEGPAHSA